MPASEPASVPASMSASVSASVPASVSASVPANQLMSQRAYLRACEPASKSTNEPADSPSHRAIRVWTPPPNRNRHRNRFFGLDPTALVFRLSSPQNDMGSKPIRTPAGWTPARPETPPGGHTVFSDLDPSAPIPSLTTNPANQMPASQLYVFFLSSATPLPCGTLSHGLYMTPRRG